MCPAGSLPASVMHELERLGYTRRPINNGIMVEYWTSLLTPTGDYWQDTKHATIKVRFGEYIDDPGGHVYLTIGQCAILLRHVNSVGDLNSLQLTLSRMIGNLE